MAKPNVYEKAPFLAFPGGCVTNQGYLERNTGWRRADLSIYQDVSHQRDVI